MVRLVVGPRRSPRPDDAEPQHRPPREGGTTSDGGCIGSKPCSAWLEARLGSAQAPDRLGLDSRLGTRLETRFGSRPDSGSGTGSALFGNRLGSKRCSPRCLRLGVGSWLRLDSKLSPISLARLVSWLSSNDLGTRLLSVRFGTWGPARLSCDDSARFGSVRGSRGKYVMHTLHCYVHKQFHYTLYVTYALYVYIIASNEINTFGRTQYFQHLNVGR